MSGGGKGTGDPVIGLLIVMAAVWLFSWGVWKIFEPQIMEGWRWVRMSQLAAVNLVMQNQQYSKWVDYMWKARGAKEGSTGYVFTAKEGAMTGKFVTDILKYPVGVMMLVLAYLCMTSIRNEFKGRFTLESFIKAQAKVWKVIAPIVDFNPGRFSARMPGDPLPKTLPLFAEPLSPEEWIAFNKIGITNNLPEKEAARRAFAAQLGPRWTGPESLPPHLKGLYAAFALKGVQRREESDELLGELATCWNHKTGFKLTPILAKRVDELIKDPKVGGKANQHAQNHAYRITALLGVLKWARKYGGVLAPGQFLWLRGVDRSVWYPLNNLGRRTFYAEGAGAMGHYMAEMNAQKPLTIPRVDTCIITLNQYITTTGARIPPLEGDKTARS